MDYRERYEKLVNSDWFKEIYHNKSLGDCPVEIPELRESEDERIKKEIAKLINFFYGSSLACEHLVSKDNMMSWLEKQGEKPSWSEYDKIQLEEAIQMIEANGTWIRSEDAVKKVSNWLKTLKPRWKPSEQELASLRTAISVLTEERNFPLAAGHLQDILNHFEGKETRNDWKPSEEQMKSLADAAQGLYACKEKDDLLDLYEDLKKL